MNAICETCGLPKDLCVCESLAKETQKIEVRVEKKKFNKVYTVVDGLDNKDINVKELGSTLKEKCACGGTVKDNRIELQGDHRAKVKDVLLGLGFPADTIHVK